MSIQIFVEGKVTPKEEFLRPVEGRGDGELLGRHLYLSLVGEVVPRTLLDVLGLSKMLLGAASGAGFLLLLPQEARTAAEEFLARTARELDALTAGELSLDWAITENLGDWTIVRKRLFEEMQRGMGTKGAVDAFVPREAAVLPADGAYFEALAQAAPSATVVGASGETPAKWTFGDGTYRYPLGYEMDSIPWVAHLDLGHLKRRRGAAMRMAVDSFEIRLRRAESVDEYLRLSHLYKNFFAGELQTLLLRLPDCNGKVAIIDSGIDGFTVYGDIDALLKVALEMHRVFATMADVNLRNTAGGEGKTVSCAIAAGPQAWAVAEATHAIQVAQAVSRDAVYLFGRVLDWEQVPDAIEIRELCLKMIHSYGANPQFVEELSGFLRESGYQSLRRKVGRFERPWRLYRRLSRALETEHDSREFQKTRNRLLAEFIGKNAGQSRLRPSGRVGLELTRIHLGA